MGPPDTPFLQLGWLGPANSPPLTATTNQARRWAEFRCALLKLDIPAATLSVEACPLDLLFTDNPW